MGLSLRYIGKVVAFLILTSFLNVCTKENDNKIGSLSKAPHTDTNLDSKEDTKMSKDSTFTSDPKTLPIREGYEVWPKKETSRHVVSSIDFEQCRNLEKTDCKDISADCLDIDRVDHVINTCRYGENVNVTCIVKPGFQCKGNKTFDKEIVCQYCYQTALWQQICNGVSTCNSLGSPRNYFKANCTVMPDVICLGSRHFNRMMPCNWKNGYRWSTAFFLSVTLGGFGADRFYLGRWQEGIGKLFSFGGLGLWTIIDIILIGVRYLGPADGSLYVD